MNTKILSQNSTRHAVIISSMIAVIALLLNACTLDPCNEVSCEQGERVEDFNDCLCICKLCWYEKNCSKKNDFLTNCSSTQWKAVNYCDYLGDTLLVLDKRKNIDSVNLMRIVITSNRTWTIPITIDRDDANKFEQDFSLNVNGKLISQLTGKLTGASKNFLELSYIANRTDTCVELWQKN